MRDYNFIKNKFSEKHTIDNSEFLDKYIKLMIEYKLSESIEYVEKHHILPRSAFPEFENEDWNIIELKYNDHVNAHLYLFKSINIRQYQRPLNFMMNSYKNSEEVSNAAKKGWVNLKNNEGKYEKWRKKKSDSMKKFRNSEKYKDHMINYFDNPNYGKKKLKKIEFWGGDRYSSDNQRRRANIFWENISDDQYLKFSQKIKDYWTEEKRIEKSKQMNDHYSNPDNILKKSIESQKRWDSMSNDEREEFNKTMNVVNKDADKRKKAGDKIKSLWESEEYLEKMKNRPHRKGTSILIIRPDGEEILVDTMRDMEILYSFSSHLVRKYRDTDLEIDDKDLKINKSLLKCKIKTIKNG